MRSPLLPRLLLACLLLLAASCEDADAVPATGPTAPPPADDTTGLDVRKGGDVGASPAPTPAVPTEASPDASPPPSPSDGSPEDPTADPAACEDPLGCYGPPERIGAFDPELIPEASGLAASRGNDDMLYLLDDAPGETSVRVVRTDGTDLGAVTIAGMDTRDGESLAVGPCGADRPEPWCLYVGDIGDNARSRDDVVVHRVPEPDLAGGVPTEAVAADTARLRYPDRPHDAEALLIDDLGRVHIVTKAPFERETRATGETRLYRAEVFGDGVLADLGVVPVPSPAAPAQSLFVGEVVTGGDHRDGRVLLRTYDAVIEYIAPEGGADLATLASWTVREVPAAFEAQSEALTFAADGCGFLTAGEMVGDIWFVPCRP